MKSVKDIEAERKHYHRDPMVNTVHRSALMVPNLPGASVEFSLLNHFLIKRGYDNVACAVTGIDANGRKLITKTLKIDQPRVYTIDPNALLDTDAAHAFQVEFYCADNLFIPYPAVMVIHRGADFCNMVHAYNRVLNDVFEDDAVNAQTVSEASIDIHLTPERQSFFLFSSGIAPVEDELTLRWRHKGEAQTATVPLSMPKLSHKRLRLADHLPHVDRRATLTVEQPRQLMFFGRMLVGHESPTGAFSANHSYYDNAQVEEYWDGDAAHVRVYPFFPGYHNLLRFYPVFSPGRLAISLTVHDHDGCPILDRQAGTIESPDGEMLEVDIAGLLSAAGIEVARVSAYTVRAAPLDGGRAPTRVNHQLVLHRGGLEASVTEALESPYRFEPAGKKGLCWGALPVGPALQTELGLSFVRDDGDGEMISVDYYDEQGHLGGEQHDLVPGQALIRRMGEGLPEPRHAGAIWYVARCDRPDIHAVSLVHHRRSGHCSGEHNF